MIRRILCSAAVVAVAAAMTPVGGTAETLKSSSALAKNREMTEAYIKFFLGEITNRSNGAMTAEFVGGPEVTPPRKQASALARGTFDITHSPSSYYSGQVPETYAILVTNMSPDELREGGGWDMLDKAHREKVNATIVAWGESEGAYNTYLTKKPIMMDDGSISLKGFKMRSTPTYRPLFEYLGATPVAMPSSEIFTGLQRGVIDGFGSPDAGIVRLGVKGLVKYQIDPSFYNMNNLIMVNLDKWNAMTEKERRIIRDAGKHYETESTRYWISLADQDETAMKASGMELINLKGRAAENYLNAANEAIWKRLVSLVGDETAAQYRAKFLK